MGTVFSILAQILYTGRSGNCAAVVPKVETYCLFHVFQGIRQDISETYDAERRALQDIPIILLVDSDLELRGFHGRQPPLHGL